MKSDIRRAVRTAFQGAKRSQNSPVPLPFWAWVVLALFTVTLYTASVPVLSAVYELNLVVAFVIATVQCGSLILAVSRPRLAAGAHLLSILALTLATRDSAGLPWPLPVAGLISLGALILLLGIRERWIVSVTVWWLSIVTLITLVAMSPERYSFPSQWGANLTIYTSYTATVLAAAIAIGQRRRIRSDLAEARRDVELEQAQRLYVEERARIARELHDVVAHSMSIIHMQALSAPIRLKGSTKAEVDQEFHDIARSARTALGELRQLLGALRSDDYNAELAPQPQLGDIHELVDITSRAGVPVTVAIDVDAHPVSPIVQLTIYRIVQEALSNVVRHAPTARTHVAIRYLAGTHLASEENLLHVSVLNEPPTQLTAASADSSPDSGGQGLRGMRERVSLLAGQLTTHPTADGGYLVDAKIPATIAYTREAR